MRQTISIIDYGYGNIYSVAKACDFVGFNTSIAKTADDILKADKLLLPGQGSFYHCMHALMPFKDALLEKLAQGTPLLGVCVGMQLLADMGYEYQPTKGLGVIGGTIDKIEKPIKGILPHIGWAAIYHNHSQKHPVLRLVNDGDYVYFVHSYRYFANNEADVALHCSYGDNFPAVVAHNNIIGCQFHPEKSQKVGLNILQGFYKW